MAFLKTVAYLLVVIQIVILTYVPLSNLPNATPMEGIFIVLGELVLWSLWLLFGRMLYEIETDKKFK